MDKEHCFHETLKQYQVNDKTTNPQWKLSKAHYVTSQGHSYFRTKPKEIMSWRNGVLQTFSLEMLLPHPPLQVVAPEDPRLVRVGSTPAIPLWCESAGKGVWSL
ncbi:hypothetical protein TNCV_3744351 [Trichonephila clavipes]|nr:hypothetical protein TNCV_3744351 [Trichonephila clavipes]